jgi:antagonist of KipI
MNMQVLSPGLLTTVQDAGRFGYRAAGVGVSGALDAYSREVANRLVGNAPGAAVLEISLHGPRLRLPHATRIALCGASIDARVGDIELPGWRPIDLPADTELQLGSCRNGCRSYLAIAGGLKLPLVLGSRSTDLRGGFGGVEGRALRAGDALPLADALVPDATSLEIAPWWIDSAPDLDFAGTTTVRILPGRDALAPADAWTTLAYRVAAASNRQGLRLEGPPLRVADARERISEPVAPGTVQLPPDGQPIVLLADAQTVGGYPRIGHVIVADLPCLAQLRPGDTLRFELCDARQAWNLACQQRQRLARIGLAIEQRRHHR